MERKKSRRGDRDPARGQATQKWYVVSYRFSKHKKILDALADLGVTTYCPQRIVWRKKRRGPRERIEYPLIPGYLFVSFRGDVWRPILSIDGIRGFLGAGGSIVACRDTDVGDMRSREATGLYDETLQILARFVAGQKVWVDNGLFPATVVTCDDEWVTVEISLMGRDVPAVLPIDRIG